MRYAQLGLAAVAMAIAITQIDAQEREDQQKGRILAQQFCGECHAVGRRNVQSPNAQAPSFVAVASTPGMTPSALNVFFQTPHRAMPNIILTSDQKSEISAYIMSLKK